jgi:hypothetical protein
MLMMPLEACHNFNAVIIDIHLMFFILAPAYDVTYFMLPT